MTLAPAGRTRPVSHNLCSASFIGFPVVASRGAKHTAVSLILRFLPFFICPEAGGQILHGGAKLARTPRTHVGACHDHEVVRDRKLHPGTRRNRTGALARAV